MLWDNVAAGLRFAFPFPRITKRHLKPGIRIRYKFSDGVANEKGSSFVLADYVFTLNIIQWPSCAVDLTLFKIIWYWSAFRCNATTIKLIKCNATQICLYRHVISRRNHHIAEKESRLAKAYLSCLVSFISFWFCIRIDVIFNIGVQLRNKWLFQTFHEHWFFFPICNPLKCTYNANKELKTDI